MIVFCLLYRSGYYLSDSIVQCRKSCWWIITSNYHRFRSTIVIIVFPENKLVHIEIEAVTLDFTRKYFPFCLRFTIFFWIANVDNRIPRVWIHMYYLLIDMINCNYAKIIARDICYHTTVNLLLLMRSWTTCMNIISMNE